MGWVAKSYMRKGFLISEKCAILTIYEEAVYMTLQPVPSEFPYRWGKFDIFFIRVVVRIT
jgi:hypothetical protein